MPQGIHPAHPRTMHSKTHLSAICWREAHSRLLFSAHLANNIKIFVFVCYLSWEVRRLIASSYSFGLTFCCFCP